MPNNPLSRSARALALLAFCLAFAAPTAQAQSQASSGQIAGDVTDANGAAVPNASVTVTNKETGLTRTATTSDDGLYTIVLLPPGTYTVVAQASNFAESKIENVVVNVGRVVDVKIALGVNAVQETVLVTAETALQVTRSESDAVVNETAISSLPINGRRFQDFVTLTPTAQIDPSRGQISLAGQKGINSNVNIDGMDYNQPFFGGIRGGERSNLAFTIPQEAIKEFQVVATGYSAEFGRSTGGIVNAVTKSGDNSLRGSAFWLFRPSRLARGNEFTDALVEQKLSLQGVDPTLAPTQHQFGGSISGRIVRDKLFYFGAYEQQRFRAPRQIIFSYPAGFPTSQITVTPAQQDVLNFYNSQQTSYTQTNDAKAGLVRADWNISPSNNFNFRFSASTNNALNAAARGETSVDPTTNLALSSNGTEQNNTRLGVGQLVTTFGSSVVNELRGQIARETRPRLSNSEIPNLVTSFANIGAAGSSTSSFLPNEEHDTRYQLVEALTYIKGNHNFKFGGEYSHINAAQTFGFNQFGRYNLSPGAACPAPPRPASDCTFQTNLQGLTNVVVPQVGTGTNVRSFLGRFDVTNASYNVQIGDRIAAIENQELAFFGQDSWRATPKLTLNYGLRLEQQFNPTPEANNTAVVNAARNTVFPIRGRGYDPSQIPDSGWQVGPRVGFAYDPQGKGQTVIRGYSGIYYARTPLIILAAPINNFRNPPGDVSAQLPVTGVNQTTFNAFLGTAAGQTYRTITGCDPNAGVGTDARNRCTPDTLYRQFAIVGVNLNSTPLNGLPILSSDQLSTIAGALGRNPNPFATAQVIGMAEDFKNPRSVQHGFGVEHQVARGLVLGVNFDYVHTTRNQRNRDINVPTPLTGQQYVDFLRANNTAANIAIMATPGGIFDQLLASGRTYIAIATPGGFINPATGLAQSTTGFVMTRPRPTQAPGAAGLLGSLQVRESTARSLYRALTFRARLVRKRVQINAYYTFSRLISDDDNERDSGGVAYSNPYDLRGEYYRSRLDRESQFMANPIFFLPYGFEVSGAFRLQSGQPFNAAVGADLNGDTVNNDRPLQVPGVEYPRNFWRNRGIYNLDMSVRKNFNFTERQRLSFSAEFFNILNRPNILVGTAAAPGTNTTFGSGGQLCSTASQICGLTGGPAFNPNFLRITDATTGAILTSNVVPGSAVFQMQLGVRYQF